MAERRRKYEGGGWNGAGEREEKEKGKKFNSISTKRGGGRVMGKAG